MTAIVSSASSFFLPGAAGRGKRCDTRERGSFDRSNGGCGLLGPRLVKGMSDERVVCLSRENLATGSRDGVEIVTLHSPCTGDVQTPPPGGAGVGVSRAVRMAGIEAAAALPSRFISQTS